MMVLHRRVNQPVTCRQCWNAMPVIILTAGMSVDLTTVVSSGNPAFPVTTTSMLRVNQLTTLVQPTYVKRAIGQVLHPGHLLCMWITNRYWGAVQVVMTMWLLLGNLRFTFQQYRNVMPAILRWPGYLPTWIIRDSWVTVLPATITWISVARLLITCPQQICAMLATKNFRQTGHPFCPEPWIIHR